MQRPERAGTPENEGLKSFSRQSGDVVPVVLYVDEKTAGWVEKQRFLHRKEEESI
jgi:hypothetical protein